MEACLWARSMGTPVASEKGRALQPTGFSRKVAIVGGCGRAGLPLGVAFASRGLTVTLHDTNQAAVDIVSAGRLPFRENDAKEPLRRAIEGGFLAASTDLAVLSTAEAVILIVGTPVDEHLKPALDIVPRLVNECAPHLVNDQLIILRSTVYPGTTRLVEQALTAHGVRAKVAFCPERTAEGSAMSEIFELPQIVAARDPDAQTRAEELFLNLTTKTMVLVPEEAELAKLFTNAWRYMKFAIANQFWMTANEAELDFARIRHAIITDYPRAADLPGAGFTAGPCLVKDTMQLAAFSADGFALGYEAIRVNESLPQYLIRRLQARYDLAHMTVGILGMAFKGGSDDPRSSLSFKLWKLLRAQAGATLCSDSYIADDGFVEMSELLDRSDLVVVGAPHPEYRELAAHCPVVDLWGITGRGVQI